MRFYNKALDIRRAINAVHLSNFKADETRGEGACSRWAAQQPFF